MLESAHDEASSLEERINQEIETNGWRFGPASVTVLPRTWPDAEGGWMVRDARGGILHVERPQTSAPSGRQVATRMHALNRHRLALDGERMSIRARLQRTMRGCGDVEVMVDDHLDGQRDGFMRFKALTTALTPSLARRPTLIDVRPYSSFDTNMPAMMRRQRRLERILDGRERRAALRICPVTAADMLGSSNPEQRLTLVGMAIDDLAPKDLPHFDDGVLIDAVRLAPDATWRNGRLNMRDVSDTIAAALVGRPLTTIVDHPLVPGDAVIRSVVGRRGGRMQVKTDVSPIPLLPLVQRLAEVAEAVRPGARRRVSLTSEGLGSWFDAVG